MKVTFTKYTGPNISGQRIQAIKDLREDSGLTLMDAKRVVDSLFEKIPIEVQINRDNLEKCHKAGFITSGYDFDVVESLTEVIKNCLDTHLFKEAANILEILIHKNMNGHYYKCTGDTGTSASSEPTWPNGSGATVVDDGITWTEQGINLFGG